MDKLRMQTANKADENFRKLAAMFPNAVTETINENGEVVRAIDKDVLMQEIACTVLDGNEERYQFTWPHNAVAYSEKGRCLRCRGRYRQSRTHRIKKSSAPPNGGALLLYIFICCVSEQLRCGPRRNRRRPA